MPVEKTNAMRLLDAHRIAYQVHAFSPDLHSAPEIAAALGVPPEIVFKTLVVLRSGGKPLLVMVPGDRELDLRRLAEAVGAKKVRMASHRQAEEMTGLQVGGISALALLHHGFEILLDRTALDRPHLLVSAGKRGLNLRLAPRDLVRVTGARTVEAVTAASGQPRSS